VNSSTPGAVGELVMAVQTGDTITTGDINYVVVAEVVHAGGQRVLEAGYSTGHLSHATEHIVKAVPWSAGSLQVAIETNGDNRLTVWVNGTVFLDETGLTMGITPPFEPYLEVQARAIPYSVAFTAYSSVCQDDLTVSGLTEGTVVSLGGRSATAHHGVAVFPEDRSSPPVTGLLSVAPPGGAPVTFASHTYWPGDRLSFRPGA
jgi:hypothetical protein